MRGFTIVQGASECHIATERIMALRFGKKSNQVPDSIFVYVEGKDIDDADFFDLKGYNLKKGNVR